jgi:hypothetical protein
VETLPSGVLLLVLLDMVWLLVSIFDPSFFGAGVFVVLPARVLEGL